MFKNCCIWRGKRETERFITLTLTDRKERLPNTKNRTEDFFFASEERFPFLRAVKIVFSGHVIQCICLTLLPGALEIAAQNKGGEVAMLAESNPVARMMLRWRLSHAVIVADLDS